jgi:hypothetical protein
MTDGEIKQTEAQIRKALFKYSTGRLNESDIRDETQKILLGLFSDSQKLASIRNLQAYIEIAAKNGVINFLDKKKRQKTDQLEDGTLLPAEVLESEPDPCQTSVLRLLEDCFPEKYDFIQKSVDYVTMLYFLKDEQPRGEFAFVPVIKSINALQKAKEVVDGFRVDVAGPGVHPGRVVNGLFYWRNGEGISRRLSSEIKRLERERHRYFSDEALRGLPQFSDFVLDSIPRLRADPIMLLLRVLYKKFRIGSGKYGARDMIRKIILELKLREAGRGCDIFKSVSEKTNFETLRKKIYKKTANPFYDKIADHIINVCGPSI